MKILLSWLQEYIDITISPAEIAKTLTMAGLEVEGVESLSPGCDQVIVGRVIAVEQHPQADKLRLATVSDGQQEHHLVCGAANCRVGLKTALAVPGATVFDDEGKPFKIKKSKIRGVESCGMLCSPQELGLKEKSEGIIEFDEHLKEGMDVASLYADTVLEIGLTPNLGHCSSYIGVARELSAATTQPVIPPHINVEEDQTIPVGASIAVEVQNKEDCPRYACRVLRNVTVGPSPDWLKKRLEASGIRSINNIVDVTNYVMLELGHPLHAFDYDLLADKRLVVKSAKSGETFVTLDGKERLLEVSDLLICDGKKPVAIAGVMGGGNSEVGDSTRNIVLEAAYFSPVAIRRTSKRLGLMTDASRRFERGTDPNVLLRALDRAAMLILQVAGGQICGGTIDIAAKAFPKKRVTCRLNRINQILGTHLSISEVENAFHRLEMVYIWNGKDAFVVDVPTYRNDIQEEIDLIEEVARVYGFDNISKGECRFTSSSIPHAPIFIFEREVRARLISEGLQEFLTCDLIGPTLLNIVQEPELVGKEAVRVLNPTSIEQSILRTSLLPGLLQVVKYNWDHQNHEVAGFEIGRIHYKEGEQYREQSVAAIVLSGKIAPHHWDSKPKECDFYDLKGIIENFMSELKTMNVTFKESHLPALHPGRQAVIYSGSQPIGRMGELHPAVQRRLDVPQRILFAEINLHELFQVRSLDNKMQEIPIYPGSERDWTITLEDRVPIADLFAAIRTNSSKLLESFTLLDIYKSDKLGKDKKNVTVRFLYRDKDKTVAQEKVDADHERLKAKISQMMSLTL